jgi:predicted enzyme related to lactoylglutathione lyase
MASVTGIGGVFFEADNPEALYEWYAKHLGIQAAEGEPAITFSSNGGVTAWSIFERDTPYFRPGNGRLMINYIVDDLDCLVEQLNAAGIVCEGRDEADYGKFAWIRDPENNRIELWQPL